MEIITHRRGSTYELQCQYTDATGVPQSIANIKVKSQIRTTAGALIADCAVTLIDINAGKFMLSVLNTADWPITGILQDIQYILSDGRKINTSPITINVITSVTQ
jgi:hypothetical protein